MSEFALKTALPQYLRVEQDRIQKIAAKEGLDFFPIVFEILTYDQMNEIAAYGGFPNRYPHWRYGMEYERLAKSYEYGLSKIYEMVINNNPSYAYLLEGNSLTDQKLVMAHVYGHVDFFKNNFCFKATDLDRQGPVTDPTRTAARHLIDGRWEPTFAGTENVDSYGILARKNGANTESDGHSTSYYRGDDDLDRYYDHDLAGNHGLITEDVVKR